MAALGMLRVERFAIRLFAREGWMVVNKTHNPQYSSAKGLFGWEVEDADWCPPNMRANRVANVLPDAA